MGLRYPAAIKICYESLVCYLIALHISHKGYCLLEAKLLSPEDDGLKAEPNTKCRFNSRYVVNCFHTF